MKQFFCDVETTGLSPYKNDIHQISGIIKINGKQEESFDLKVRPRNAEEIEVKALQISGVNKEDILAYPEATSVYLKLKTLFTKYIDPYDSKDKMFFLGYNSTFDDNFLRQFWFKSGDKFYNSWFYYPPIDVAVLSAEHFKHKRYKFPNFKLMTVAKIAGINVETAKLHDAFYDIKITDELYNVITRQSKTL